jgi:pyruvate dehydrogenase E2 component (dihydrolipoamide acetyltransferase)
MEASRILPQAATSAGAGLARDGVRIPHSTARRVIARRLSESKREIPHFYLTLDCEIDKLLAIRSEINALQGSALKVSVNDLIIKAAAIALGRVPQANASWTEDAVVQFVDIDISVAVATDSGLITPIIRGADKKSVGAISTEMKSLAQRARENKLAPHEFQGGSFSISNLGMLGVKSFSAIINPPQSCILAVGAAEKRPVCRGDSVVAATVITTTLSVDHRAVDGATGARLLKEVKSALENPLGLLV